MIQLRMFSLIGVIALLSYASYRNHQQPVKESVDSHRSLSSEKSASSIPVDETTHRGTSKTEYHVNSMEKKP